MIINKNMKTAKQKLKDALKGGDHKTALRIAKSFRIEFNSEEQRIIQIAYECMTGKESFYKSLKHDTEKFKVQAILLLEKL